MGMSKIIKVIVSLALVVFLALAATKIEAEAVDYDVLIHGNTKACDTNKHPHGCPMEKVNRYRIGCHPSQHCRT
ncbi:unnamed protein product [Eruca vesicaria subsp. sativa]|uniref:Uncharacterized protein n=1 Tax=Eruca vesicaria subsp. sativa TaxID=29727 RepID=A0ABC8JEC0_ERUVS|nr:unnamed protein product [Eruca vesicaria subsp. sativa]